MFSSLQLVFLLFGNEIIFDVISFPTRAEEQNLIFLRFSPAGPDAAGLVQTECICRKFNINLLRMKRLDYILSTERKERKTLFLSFLM